MYSVRFVKDSMFSLENYYNKMVQANKNLYNKINNINSVGKVLSLINPTNKAEQSTFQFYKELFKLNGVTSYELDIFFSNYNFETKLLLSNIKGLDKVYSDIIQAIWIVYILYIITILLGGMPDDKDLEEIKQFLPFVKKLIKVGDNFPSLNRNYNSKLIIKNSNRG